MTMEWIVVIALASVVLTAVNVYFNARFTSYLIRREARYQELRAEGKSYAEAAKEVESTVSFWH